MQVSNIKCHINHPVGAEFIYADRQTDMTKVTGSFHKYANMPKSLYGALDGEKLQYPEKHVPLCLPLIQHGLAWVSTMTSVSVKPSNVESLYTAVSGLYE
jgi:hypothetical protein